MKRKSTEALELVKLCCGVLDDKKAEGLSVLDVSAQSSITDYLILATATSEPHLRALRIELERAIDSSGARLVGMEAQQHSGWIVIDAFDVMVHLFLAQTREHYALDRLWQDAVEISVPSLVASPAAAARSHRVPTKPRTRKTSAPRKRRKQGP
jgi:ribosome-associated protein